MPDEMVFISLRTEILMFSHETALFLHGISDRTPFVHSITVPSDKIPSPALREECKVYYIKPELFDLGRTKKTTTFGNQVPCYDLERTVCDIIRSRNKMGTETFLAALKRSTMLYEQFGELKYKYRNRQIWCRGYYVDTAGKNVSRIAEYIENQLKEDELGDQLRIPGTGPFTGGK